MAPSDSNPFDWQQRQARRAQSQTSPQQPPPSSMKRPGSRSRVPHLRPEYADDLGSNAPDLERKNKSSHKKFREKRDGYESDEGEAHRKSTKGRSRRDYDSASSEDEKPRRHGDRDRRSRREADYDDEPPRRRRPKDDEGYGYGSEPARHHKDDRRDRRRRDDYSDESSEDDRRARRRRSPEDRKYKSEGSRRDKDSRRYEPDSRDARRRREEIYDRDRDARRSDRRHSYPREDELARREPRQIKVGKYDIGPYVEQGQKHYKTLAPILTPIVMNMAKNYMSSKSGGGGGRR